MIKWNSIFAACLLGVCIFGAFSPCLQNQFLNYDDDIYVTDNRHITTGITRANLQWAFVSVEAQNWHPLTWLSHMTDCQLFDLKPWGHHLTNIAFHSVNVALLFLLLSKITSKPGISFVAAALFGLHPLRVESVAWVAERKDVLSAFFGILCLFAYLTYAQMPDRGTSQKESTAQSSLRFWAQAWRYILTLTLFALGLMSKPMLVTFPFLLLLLDCWPLARFRRDQLVRILAEKIPFFLLAAGSCWITFFAQKEGEAMVKAWAFPLTSRLENAVVSYLRYLAKLIWPTNLAVFYPYQGEWPLMEVWLCSALVLGISTFVILQFRKRPYLLVGWFWFLGTLLPVIGLVQVGLQSMADRYTYIPTMGLFVTLAAGLTELSGRRVVSQRATVIVASIAIVASLVVTIRQERYWENDWTLFSHARAVTKDNHVAAFHLGIAALYRDSNYPEAINLFREVVRLRPLYDDAHCQLGVALFHIGKLDEAIGEIEQAIRLNPKSVEAYGNLGNILCAKGRVTDGIQAYERAIALKPDSIEGLQNLGMAYCRIGQFDQGIKQFQQVLQLAPDSASAHFYIGTALAGKGDRQKAAEELGKALKLRPNYPEALAQLRALRISP